MPLPHVDAVRALRLRHAAATQAHHLVHPLNELLVEAPHGGPDAALRAAELLDDLEARWGHLLPTGAFDLPPVDTPPTVARNVERLTAARDQLLPVAQQEHTLHHELEHLLREQYEALQSDPAHAEVRAILDPLYAEREALFATLHPAYHRRSQMQAALAVFDEWLERLEAAREGLDDDPHGVKARNRHGMASTLVELITGSLVPMGLTEGLEARCALDPADREVPVAALREETEAVHAALRTYRAAQAEAHDVLDVQVNAEHRRWDAIEAALHEHTG